MLARSRSKWTRRPVGLAPDPWSGATNNCLANDLRADERGRTRNLCWRTVRLNDARRASAARVTRCVFRDGSGRRHGGGDSIRRAASLTCLGENAAILTDQGAFLAKAKHVVLCQRGRGPATS